MTKTNLYSVFLDYRGGTYVSQVNGANAFEALEVWARSLPEKDLVEWGLRRESLQAAIRDGSLVPLADRVNVWCLSGIVEEDEQILINAVATVSC